MLITIENFRQQYNNVSVFYDTKTHFLVKWADLGFADGVLTKGARSALKIFCDHTHFSKTTPILIKSRSTNHTKTVKLAQCLSFSRT